MQHITDSSVSLAPVAAAPVDVPPNDPVPLLDAPPHDHSRLEGLPAEVRRSILSVLDLECLKGLVRASPTFHQQYLHDRRHVLSVSLHVTLGTASLDAFNVQKAQALESSTPESLESSTLEWKSELLEDWRGSLPHRSSFQLAGVVSEDEAVAMARFYIDVVVPVARYFMKDALGAMRVLDASPIDRSSWEAGPSGTEWRRCLRAAYRFQLLCCIAKPGPRVMPSDVFRATRDSLNRAIKATGIFYAPEPWESEELVTFYEFAEGVYQRVFSNLAAKLRPYKSSVESFESLTAFAIRDYQEGATLRGGLRLLRTVLIDLDPEDRDLLVDTLQPSIVKSHIPISRMKGIISCKFQRLRLEKPSENRDKLMMERAPLPFRGDDLDRPPLGWTDMWDGTYSSLFGGFTSNMIRRWGYVFWDADRMNRLGRRQLLRAQWTDYWDGDPRRGISYGQE